MSEKTQNRRLPRGERCTQCGDRRYYLENGRRFCAANGHEIEGYVQFDLGDEEDSGRQGVITRKQKEVRVQERRTLTGLPGKSLFLESLQLIIRNQLMWLVKQKGLRPELETVVRDLWDLRIRGFGGILPAPERQGKELEVFSSQPTSDTSEDEKKPKVRRQSWSKERGSDWPMPRVQDTLALCYLGCLLLRIPMRIGQLFAWAAEGHIPYNNAWLDLPQEMRDRMPSPYGIVLKRPLTKPLQRDQLHDAIQDLAVSYYHNYRLTFPNLSVHTLLVEYAELFALPIEAIQAAKAIIDKLDLSFQYAVLKSQRYPVDQPEILLVASLIVATKICFPNDESITRQPQHGFAPLPRLSWAKWQETIVQLPGNSSKISPVLPVELPKVTAHQIVDMPDDELADFFSRLASLTDGQKPHRLAQFFPVGGQQAGGASDEPVDEIMTDDIDMNVKTVLASILRPADKLRSGGVGRLPSLAAYRSQRTVDDLTSAMKSLYALAAHESGLKLSTMVKGVAMLEQRIIRWQKSPEGKRSREKRRQRSNT